MNKTEVGIGDSYSDVILLEGSQECQREIVVGSGAKVSLAIVALAHAGDEISCRLDVRFAGTEGSCTIRGLYIASENSRVTIDTFVGHDYPDCYSDQLFKGILSGSARTSFEGLIRVPGKCIGTEAYQQNHNLLLGDDCVARALPHLEIYADDVKCSHGATMGRLNDDELFYLRSRGIDLKEAQRLQMIAFAGEVLEGLPEDVATKAHAALEAKE